MPHPPGIHIPRGTWRNLNKSSVAQLALSPRIMTSQVVYLRCFKHLTGHLSRIDAHLAASAWCTRYALVLWISHGRTILHLLPPLPGATHLDLSYHIPTSQPTVIPSSHVPSGNGTHYLWIQQITSLSTVSRSSWGTPCWSNYCIILDFYLHLCT